MKNRILVSVAVAAWTAAALSARAQTGDVADAAAPDKPLTATGLLASCVACLPHEPLTLSGTLSVRKQRGIVVAEYPYRLKLDWGATPQRVQCDLLDDKGDTQERLTILRRDSRSEVELRAGPNLARQPVPALTTPVCGTDMTWLDLTLDFLWWPDVRLDGQDTVRGHDCYKVVSRPPAPIPGCSGVRLWLDAKMRCMLRVEQLDAQGQPTRRMSVRTVKEFNKRWLIGELEIETLGSEFRTRLRVDDVLTP